MIKIDTILSMKKTKLENNEAIITKPRENLIESSENIDYPKPDQNLKKILLITGNKNKLNEFKAILDGKIILESYEVDLPEYQGECEEIAKKKVLLAFEKVKKPVIVEDTSLCFNALKGLPGPYIKWFLESLGHDGLNKMIHGFEDKSAYAQCIIAYMDEGLQEPTLFIGKTPGKIVPARGDNKFGWDPIFEPEGFDLTYAQMAKEEKNKISHRYRAIENFMKSL